MAFCKAIEPGIPSDQDHRLEDLAYELVSAASALAGQLHPVVQNSVGDLVRSMNCYYSNLIEGHNTVPRDIERVLAHEYSAEPQKRDLQLEAVAHIEVQSRIDSGSDDPSEPVSKPYVRWLHREFCSRLPDSLLWVENPDTGERIRVEPGDLRTRYVKVGMHVPPTGEELEECLLRFAEIYTAPSHRDCGRAPSAALDSPLLGWQWTRGATRGACDVSTIGRREQSLGGIARPRSKCSRIQIASNGGRPAPRQ